MPADEQLDNTAINDAIRRAAEETSFAVRLLAQGKAVVYMDDDGQIVTRYPGDDRLPTD